MNTRPLRTGDEGDPETTSLSFVVGASGLFLKNKKAKTSLYRDSFFVRICNIWNALLDNVRAEKELLSFAKKLKSFVNLRLRKVFNQGDIRFFKLVCVKCRRFDALNSCACQSTSFFFLFPLFLSFVNDNIFCYFLAWRLASGLGFNFVCLLGIGKGNLPSREQPCPIVNLPAFGKLLNK